MSESSTKTPMPEESKLLGDKPSEDGEVNRDSEETIDTTTGVKELDKSPEGRPTFTEIMADDFIFEAVLDFFDFQELFVYFYPLSREFQVKLEEANYLQLK